MGTLVDRVNHRERGTPDTGVFVFEHGNYLLVLLIAFDVTGTDFPANLVVRVEAVIQT